MANDIIKKAEKKYAIDLTTYKLSRTNIDETLIGLALWKDFYNRVREMNCEYPMLSSDPSCKPDLLKDCNFSFSNYFNTRLLKKFKYDYVHKHSEIEKSYKKKHKGNSIRENILSAYKVLKYPLSIGLAVLIYYLVNGWTFNIGTFFAGAAALICSFLGFWLIQFILTKIFNKMEYVAPVNPYVENYLSNDENFQKELQAYRNEEEKKYLAEVKDFNTKSKIIKNIKKQITNIFDMKDFQDEKWVDSCFFFINNGLADSYKEALDKSREEDYRKKVVFGMSKTYETFKETSNHVTKRLDQLTYMIYQALEPKE